MNDYQRKAKSLESERCSTCGGTGQCDDASPGDIYCETWTCPDCGGSGLRKEHPND